MLSGASKKAESGDKGGAEEELKEAEKKILDSPLKDRPRLAGLLRDIRKVREAVVDKAVRRALCTRPLVNYLPMYQARYHVTTSAEMTKVESYLYIRICDDIFTMLCPSMDKWKVSISLMW